MNGKIEDCCLQFFFNLEMLTNFDKTKTMRHLICLLIIGLFASTTLFSQKKEKEIGANNNGVYSISTTMSELQEIFNKHLEKAGFKTSVKTIEIRKGTIAVTNETYYMLYAENSSRNVKIAVDLKLKDNKFIATLAENTFDLICVCSGCNKGCSPQRITPKEVVWKCSTCQDNVAKAKGKVKKAKSKCMKTVTVR